MAIEAHLVAVLSRATKHLILIGDHLQLRPGTAVYELAKRYGLDVSMFERLVRNGVQHATLARQRRMRPPIARLIQGVYPHLQARRRAGDCRPSLCSNAASSPPVPDLNHKP